MVFKAVSFAAIGVINSLVDAGVFFLAYTFFIPSLVAANVTSWLVAVSGSYVMNSYATFAAESGRELRLGKYLAFLASGAVGLAASTAALVLAAQAMPVWAAKGLSIGVAFLVNFSMSHFVVFRARPSARRASSE